jgi:DNA repair photolyase
MNRLTEGGLPFEWTVNPYRGCEVGCRYCYARPTHEWLGHGDPADFEERIYVKTPEDGRLVAALRRARDAGQEIAIGTATDPYQPAEGRFGVTRAVLRMMLAVPGLRVSLTTKSAGVARDVPLLRSLAARSDLTVNVSLISLDASLLRALEPRAPRPDLRLAALARLASAGIATRLFVMPILPLLTDGEESLRALLTAARGAGAREVAWKVLFLRGATRGYFLDVLARAFPRARPAYQRLYAGGASAAPEYRAAMDQLMTRLGRETALPGTPRDAHGPAAPTQLSLVW